jgi:hypothetical protein
MAVPLTHRPEPAQRVAQRGDARMAVARRLSTALVVVAVAASVLTLVPGVLRGVPAMNGSARATVVMLLLVTTPLLVAGMFSGSRGSVAGLLVWLGAIAHLLYNAVMLLFATPFNEVFLLYVALLSLSIWSVIAVLSATDVAGVPAGLPARLPVRPIAVYVWTIVVLNAGLWLQGLVPGMRAADDPAFLAGTGLLTNPVYVQDLAWWLPLMTVGAWWLWQRQPWGYVVTGAGLVMWTVESFTVGVDQWVGHVADPSSPAVSAAAVPVLFGLGVVGLVVVRYFFADRR